MPNGKNGATGPNAQPLVARGPKSGPELAVSQLLEGTSSALEITQKRKIARHPSVQVIPMDAVCGQQPESASNKTNKLHQHLKTSCYPLPRKEFSVATMNIVLYFPILLSNKQILTDETLSTNAATASGICQ